MEHHGARYTVDGLRFLPRPRQRPRIPIWVAAQSIREAPLRRAARYDGLCPEAGPEDLQEMLKVIRRYRCDSAGFEVAVAGPTGADPGEYRRAGATWWLTALPEITTRAQAHATVEQGPPRH